MTSHIGSSFDDFLSDDGLLGDCKLVAQERVLDHVASLGLDSKLEEILKLFRELENQRKLDPDSERIFRGNLLEDRKHAQ
jgi:hypothetical protein